MDDDFVLTNFALWYIGYFVPQTCLLLCLAYAVEEDPNNQEKDTRIKKLKKKKVILHFEKVEGLIIWQIIVN